jgi:hypothetical protein
MTDVLIGVPSRGNVRVEWATMLLTLEMPVNLTYAVKIVTGETVEEARNILVQEARELETKYLFFLDDDVLVPNQTINRRVYVLENERDVDLLTGIVPVKSPGGEPCIFKEGHASSYWDWTFNERFDVDSCGMAACMIRMGAFEKVGEPWFEWIKEKKGPGHTYELGEDVGFCKKLKDAGGRILADGGILCGHIDEAGKVYTIPEDCGPIERGKDKLGEFVKL